MNTLAIDQEAQPSEKPSQPLWLVVGCGPAVMAPAANESSFSAQASSERPAGAGPKRRPQPSASGRNRSKNEGEETFDQKLLRALERLGVPTRDQVLRLTRRIEELTHEVEQLEAHTARSATPRS